MFRLIIVEDEAILRKGICNIIDWTSLGFQLEGDFANAPEALAFFREHPVDLVVTDIKMPEMSGIELARKIHALSPATKVIILTAFSDFDLAVDALRAGVSDYIVKSDFISQLPVSVKKVYALLENEKAKISCSSRAFSALISGIATSSITNLEDIQYWFCQMQLQPQQYMAVKFSVCADTSAHEEEQTRMFEKIIGFIKTAAEPFPSAVKSDAQNSVYVLLYAANTVRLPQMPEFGESIISAAKTLFACGISLSYSSVHQDIAEFPSALYECLDAADSGVLNAAHGLPEFPGGSTGQLLDPIGITTAFTENICAGDTVACAGLLTYFFGELESKRYSLNKVKNMAINICTLCWDKLYSPVDTMYQFHAIKDMTLARLKNSAAVVGLVDSLLAFADNCLHLQVCSASGIPVPVLEISAYIQHHFDQPVRIDDIAHALHMNSSYLSRTYKNCTGHSIIHALNYYRIEHAKVLLETGKYKITEIASMVGIEEPAYFTTVFTKYTGCSPSSYKVFDIKE